MATTGSTNQNNPPSLAALLAAARHDNLSALRQQIDFAVSGVAPMVRALWAVDAPDREALAHEGLAELETAGEHPELVHDLLEILHRALADATDAYPASAPQTERALAALRAPNLPTGLTPETHARLEALAIRSKTVSVVYEVPISSATPLFLALVPDTGQIALPHT